MRMSYLVRVLDNFMIIHHLGNASLIPKCSRACLIGPVESDVRGKILVKFCQEIVP